jgi:hypothetical protein
MVVSVLEVEMRWGNKTCADHIWESGHVTNKKDTVILRCENREGQREIAKNEQPGSHGENVH